MLVVQHGDMQHIIVLKDVRLDAKLLRNKAQRCDTAALTVTAVVHLFGWLVDMPRRYRFGAAEAHHAAAALFLSLIIGGEGQSHGFVKPLTGG